MTQLSVNVNKIAVLRNSRGGNEPSVEHAARTCIEAGAQGITVHPRPDQRHIRPQDVLELADLCHGKVEYNIEGNPFAPPRGAYPGLLELVRATRPAQVTLVPDGDAQLTSDHGFSLPGDIVKLWPLVAALRAHAGRVSVFVDAGATDFTGLVGIGVARIEIYTGPYAEACVGADYSAALDACVRTARAARAAGVLVNAGHDLNQRNLPQLRAFIPDLAEVSIGHALISEALYTGLAPAVHAYLALLRT
ncbi:pyridoxine 5'-phosphate synthase [Metallibacterium scheffleri]|uniref:Pyridoxine 5'-phosphate synthase n=1 Tax=Metallibacterium scheffleri TaxID=993689 RepID=A0A4S3KRZ0_9GAMM|nr:pyridoxine 5'-phosphate synthase [Metallibacterium scheffleri]THD11819.1 pyridoxine 5'-phosphate synthase [Metallibacterium scheffleri]